MPSAPADDRLRQRQQDRHPIRSGLAQLSLVEHALCPLDDRLSLVTPLVYDTGYFRADKSRKSKFIPVRVVSQEGLSASDELYLWGLVAATFAQNDPSMELWATPHWCLRQLGMLTSSKGGKNYRNFYHVLRRLAGTTYFCDHFFDPNRQEERRRSFGFLKYDLPLRDDSPRAWRIVWDPLFFEYCRARGGRMSFDIETYRRLDCATRRLFLMLSKVFWRRTTSPLFHVHHLAVRGLGFSETVPIADLKIKITRCIEKLLDLQVISLPPETRLLKDLFRKKACGSYAVRLTRGPYFEQNRKPTTLLGVSRGRLVDSPLFEPLQSIGFDDATAKRILRNYSQNTIRVWADITLAGMERPRGFAGFKKSPQAYFMDNVKHAAKGQRTPPDWWHTLKKRERNSEARCTQIDFEEHREAWEEARRSAFTDFIENQVGRDRYEKSVKSLREVFAATLPDRIALENAITETERHYRASFDFPDLLTWVLQNWRELHTGAPR